MKLTEEIINNINEISLVETAIIQKTWIIKLFRRVYISFSIDPGNTYVYIQEIEDCKNGKQVTDIVCLFNSDYDGELTIEYLEGVYKSLTGKDFTYKPDNKYICDKCQGEGKEDHTCPFSEDINGDDTPCNCCEECEHQCAMDI